MKKDDDRNSIPSAFDSRVTRWLYHRIIFKLVRRYRNLSPHRLLAEAKIFIRETLIQGGNGKLIAPNVILIKTPQIAGSERLTIENTQAWLREELQAYVQDCGYVTRQKLVVQLLADRLYKGETAFFQGWVSDEILEGTRLRSFCVDILVGKRKHSVTMEIGDKFTIGSTSDCEIQAPLGSYKGKLLYLERLKTKVKVVLLTSQIQATDTGKRMEANFDYAVDWEAKLEFEKYLSVIIHRDVGGKS